MWVSRSQGTYELSRKPTGVQNARLSVSGPVHKRILPFYPSFVKLLATIADTDTVYRLSVHLYNDKEIMALADEHRSNSQNAADYCRAQINSLPQDMAATYRESLAQLQRGIEQIGQEEQRYRNNHYVIIEHCQRTGIRGQPSAVAATTPLTTTELATVTPTLAGLLQEFPALPAPARELDYYRTLAKSL